MRAPPESFNPITGAPLRIAKSMILQIFCALDSESEPPNTVKSCANTYASRPSIRPNPVTNPSPAGLWASMPKSVQWWRTNLSSSSNVPSSNRRLILSRAVSLPALCPRSRRSAPPPASASWLRRSSSSIRPVCEFPGVADDFFSGKRASRGWRFVPVENADSEVSCQPHGAKEQHNSKDNFRGDRAGALQRRGYRGDLQRGADQHEHSCQGHRDDQQGGEYGGEKSFHERDRALGINPRLSLSVNTSAVPQRKPDQSSATRIESTGFAGSYLMLAGCPATSRSSRTWLSSPVISCAV